MSPVPSLRERFEPKVRRASEDECHDWTASLTSFGHGQISVNGRPRGAHVVSWELENGPVPKGLCVLHICDNARCVNVRHLYLGTRGDNNRDTHSRNRWQYIAPGNGKGRRRTGGRKGVAPIAEAERFWPKVDKHGGDIERCWEFLGAAGPFGYGLFWVYELKRKTYAHRVAYGLHYGQFDNSLIVRHACDNPICCNPHHLRLGTRADNNRDRAERKRGREQRQWGEDNASAKITWEMACEIRRLHAEGMSQMKIAPMFGIKQPQVSRIIRGVSWTKPRSEP